MGLFSNLGSCCFRPATVAAEPPEVVEEAARRANTDVNMQLLTSRDLGHAKRDSCSGAHWRPALSAISEDGTVSCSETKGERRNKVQSEKEASSKGRSMANHKTRGNVNYGHGKNDNYRHHNSHRNDRMQMAIPAFSPTPFMF